MKNIRAILDKLKSELRRAEDVDIDARETVNTLHRDLEQIAAADALAIESVVNRLEVLETQFAANHPTLERLARELADAIGKMGI